MSNPHPQNQIKKGDKLALGNDKSLRLSTWVDKYLDDEIPNTLPGYVEGLTYRKYLSKKLLNLTAKMNDGLAFKAMFSEIRNTTEGMPKQSTEITGKDGGPIEFAKYSDEDLKKIINGIE